VAEIAREVNDDGARISWLQLKREGAESFVTSASMSMQRRPSWLDGASMRYDQGPCENPADKIRPASAPVPDRCYPNHMAEYTWMELAVNGNGKKP